VRKKYSGSFPPIIPASRFQNLERSLAFWRDVLDFEFSHTAHQKGELAHEITGIEGLSFVRCVDRTAHSRWAVLHFHRAQYRPQFLVGDYSGKLWRL